MTRKRFIKLAMSQGCSKRVAVWASIYSRVYYSSYKVALKEYKGNIANCFDEECLHYRWSYM